MKIELATKQYENKVVTFFDKYLDKDNKAITCREFFCPFGTKAAIKRKQVIITLDNEKIIAAARFYPRKSDSVVSVYQFAIGEKNRGAYLLKKMLSKTEHTKFEILCPIESSFNEYYKKTDWVLKTKNKNYNYWRLCLD